MRLLLLTLLFTMPVLVSAVTADELQVQIEALLNRIEVVRQQIAIEEARVGAVSTTVPTFTPANTSCAPMLVNLERGARGQMVTNLQNFLVKQGVYSSTLVTGYFGPATQAGVQRFQVKEGIVSYGSPSTTGYGRVGPSTRRVMNAKCGQGRVSVQAPVVEKYSLSVNPQNGGAPHKVQANFAINGSSCTSYSLDWGDGSFATQRQAKNTTNCEYEDINRQLSHTYTVPGVYTVQFKTGKGSLAQIRTVSRVVIAVTGNSVTGNTAQEGEILTVSELTGTAPVSITASFRMNGSSCTSYSLDWGDGSVRTTKQGTTTGACTKDFVKRSITHTYITSGTYTVSLRIGQNTDIQDLLVTDVAEIVLQ